MKNLKPFLAGLFAGVLMFLPALLAVFYKSF